MGLSSRFLTLAFSGVNSKLSEDICITSSFQHKHIDSSMGKRNIYFYLDSCFLSLLHFAFSSSVCLCCTMVSLCFERHCVSLIHNVLQVPNHLGLIPSPYGVTSGGIAYKQNVIQFSSKYQGISLKYKRKHLLKAPLDFQPD